MGWQDREYAQPPGFGGSPFGGEGLRHMRDKIVTTLIIANVVVFVLTSVTGGPDPLRSGLFQAMALHTPSVLHGQVWRLITAQYLHWSGGHLFMNMLGLYFLGKPLVQEWGTKQFLAVYTIAGLVGNLFFVTLTAIGWLAPESIAAGASGCVLGLLGAAAVRYPHAQVWIFFMFPLRIRTAALIFAGFYALNLISRGPNAGGDACHIAGMLVGALWAFRGADWWRRRGGASYRVIGGSRRGHGPFNGSWLPWRAWRQAPGRVRPSVSPSVFKQRVEQRRADEETVDRILKKVYEGGIHSLSDEEKRTLREATERQRAGEAGRVDRI